MQHASVTPINEKTRTNSAKRVNIKKYIYMYFSELGILKLKCDLFEHIRVKDIAKRKNSDIVEIKNFK